MSKEKAPTKGNENNTSSAPSGSAGTITYEVPIEDSLVDYGVGYRCCPSGPAKDERFYVTTAINYANGLPHIGHAYEGVTTDVLARFHRLCGRKVFFLTGADEHGQKIANMAQSLGVEPIDLCDKHVNCFKALNQRLKISNDWYLRSTSRHHHETCKALWEKCAASGDIYLGKYEGWYNVREETFITELEAEAMGFKDPTSGLPLTRMSEESYFFRMSKYQDRLKQHILDNPAFIQPEMYKNNILSRLQEPLGDLSISRTSFTWGIEMPDAFDQNHVMYVWFDALTNYLSGVHGLEADHPDSPFWPATCHIIGKDIIWFHCVIWPCMLMSASIPLPQTVFSHGFVNDKEGKKMSKSMGNVIDPHDMLNKYCPDVFRWYICREAPYGSELSFSEESLILMVNAELADTLGNLAHRGLNLLQKFNNGVVPEPTSLANIPVPFNLEEMRTQVCSAFATYQLQSACISIMAALRDVNKWITELEPWKMKGDELAPTRLEIVRLTVEALYAIAHFLAPFIPDAMTQLFKKINRPPMASLALSPSFNNIPPGTQTTVGGILFEKLGPLSGEKDAKESKPSSPVPEAPKGKKATPPPGKGGEMQGKGGNKSNSPTQQESKGNEDPACLLPLLDIRVGKITKVWEHPDSDKLFCEEIDVGESEPRQIASGLRKHYTLEQMEGRHVCVVCNLKTAKLGGFPSAGMVLAATGEDGKVELVTPPEKAGIGERLFVEGFSGEPASSAQVSKKKLMEKVATDLKTNSEKIACYRDMPILTSVGPVFVDTVVNGAIH